MALTVIPGGLNIGCGFDGLGGTRVRGAQIYHFTYPSLTGEDPPSYPGTGSLAGGTITLTPPPSVATPAITWMVPYDIDVVTDETEADLKSFSTTSSAVVSTSLALEMGVTGGFGEFSASAQATYCRNTYSAQSYFYSVGGGFGEFYALAMPTSFYTGPIPTSDTYTTIDSGFLSKLAALPTPFNISDPSNLEQYNNFFTTWGTHVIVGATMGYKMRLIAAVQKAEVTATSTATAAITAQYGTAASGQANGSYLENYATYAANSSVMATCYGGSAPAAQKLIATALSTSPVPANTDFETWLGSCYSQPGTVQLDLVYIWQVAAATGASNAVIAALQNAYFYMAMQNTVLPVFAYAYTYSGTPADQSYFYTTFENPEGIPNPPASGGFTQLPVAFYVLPQGTPYANPPVSGSMPGQVPNLQIQNWPFQVQKLERYHASFIGQQEGSEYAWGYTFNLNTSPTTVPFPEPEWFVTQYSTPPAGPDANNYMYVVTANPPSSFVPVYRRWCNNHDPVTGMVMTTATSFPKTTGTYPSGPFFYAGGPNFLGAAASTAAATAAADDDDTMFGVSGTSQRHA